MNQNSTGNQELFNKAGHIVWMANAPNSVDKYIALFNTHDPVEGSGTTEQVGVKFKDIGLEMQCTVRDLWAKKDLGEFSDEFAADIPFHGAGLYKISPK